ncbi:hypothetical protein E1B28_006934 [Marasmius oreades]|uniref:Uncharacterized protein n=1 Tax=Marasmius oreades TaxID=181124 RepID=A0A9P7S171_9AGAR|nr:uncharacterized protein E1B28_006934 [Marasmius oreades]KAG7093248.1 hypothetical protein E1B28_006934 [Marasmius oreades]
MERGSNMEHIAIVACVCLGRNGGQADGRALLPVDSLAATGVSRHHRPRGVHDPRSRKFSLARSQEGHTWNNTLFTEFPSLPVTALTNAPHFSYLVTRRFCMEWRPPLHKSATNTVASPCGVCGFRGTDGTLDEL